MTFSGVESVEVKVATPAPSLVPLPPEESEALPDCETTTALPETGLPYWSFRVTVTVVAAEPSATTGVGLAVTVETAASTPSPLTAVPALVPVIEEVTVSVAVTVRVPAVFSTIAEKVCAPASPPVKV